MLARIILRFILAFLILICLSAVCLYYSQSFFIEIEYRRNFAEVLLISIVVITGTLLAYRILQRRIAFKSLVVQGFVCVLIDFSIVALITVSTVGFYISKELLWHVIGVSTFCFFIPFAFNVVDMKLRLPAKEMILDKKHTVQRVVAVTTFKKITAILLTIFILAIVSGNLLRFYASIFFERSYLAPFYESFILSLAFITATFILHFLIFYIYLRKYIDIYLQGLGCVLLELLLILVLMLPAFGIIFSSLLMHFCCIASVCYFMPFTYSAFKKALGVTTNK